MAPRPHALQRHASWEDFDPADDNTAKCGWLLKRSNGKGLLRLGSLLPHWNRRWVILNAVERQLKYYRDQTDDEPLGCVALMTTGGQVRVTWDPPSLEFVVHTSTRDLRFKAESAAAAASWVSAIRGQSGTSSSGGGEPSSNEAKTADGGEWAPDDGDASPATEGVADVSLEYVEPSSILDQLSAKLGAMPSVRLLRWSFLDERAQQLERAPDDATRAALALPRRQELERVCPEAFYSAAEVASLERGNFHFAGGPLRVVAISHCWRSAAHPDPMGATLVQFARAVRIAQTNPEERHNSPLPTELAIFLDWCSLPQKGADGMRTAEEQAAFSAALGSMQLWYAHQLTTVFLMTNAGAEEEPGSGSASYDDRGWTTFERQVAMLGKRTSQHAWPLLIEVCAGPDGAIGPHVARRSAPLPPERFRELISTKAFTNGADAGIVTELYAITAHRVIGSASVLKFGGLGWGDEELEQLCVWLPQCKALHTLSLVGNHIGDRGVLALTAVAESGSLRVLHELNLSSNPIGEAGLLAFTAAIRAGHLPALETIAIRRADASESTVAELRHAVKASVKRQREAKRRAGAPITMGSAVGVVDTYR